MRVDWDDARVRREAATIAWSAHLPVLERRVRESVAAESPVDTGAMQSAISASGVKRLPGAGPLGLAGLRVDAQTDYSYIVHEGRGEVRPVNAKALHWINRLGDHVFAQKSKAVPPNRFIVRGLQKIGLRVKRTT